MCTGSLVQGVHVEFGLTSWWVRRWEKDKEGDDAGVTGDPRPATGWLGDAAAFSFGSSGRYVVGAGTPGCTPSFCFSPPPGTYSESEHHVPPGHGPDAMTSSGAHRTPSAE